MHKISHARCAQESSAASNQAPGSPASEFTPPRLFMVATTAARQERRISQRGIDPRIQAGLDRARPTAVAFSAATVVKKASSAADGRFGYLVQLLSFRTDICRRTSQNEMDISRIFFSRAKIASH